MNNGHIDQFETWFKKPFRNLQRFEFIAGIGKLWDQYEKLQKEHRDTLLTLKSQKVIIKRQGMAAVVVALVISFGAGMAYTYNVKELKKEISRIKEQYRDCSNAGQYPTNADMGE